MKPFTEKEWKDFRELIRLHSNEIKDTILIMQTVELKNEDAKKKEIKRLIVRYTNLIIYFSKRLDLSTEILIAQFNQFAEIMLELNNGNVQSVTQLNLLHPIFVEMVE